MNKRKEKKVGTRYNLLRQAKRQTQKRKGEKCIAYAMVEMGANDLRSFQKGGFDTEYPCETHWLVKVLHRKNVYFDKKHAPFQTLIYPCTSEGTSDSEGPVHIMFHWREHPDEMLPFFERIVNDMKHDQYWDADY